MLSTPAQKRTGILVLLLCLAGILSCEKDGPECYVPLLVRTGNAFIITDTQYIQVDTMPQRDSLIYVYRDSVMRNAQMKILIDTPAYIVTGTEQNGNLMHIALNPLKDSTRYAFRADTASSIWDTITYYYTPVSHFVSNSCGYTFYYTLNGVKTTKHILDSAAVPQANVTTDITTRHVQLYFKRNF